MKICVEDEINMRFFLNAILYIKAFQTQRTFQFMNFLVLRTPEPSHRPFMPIQQMKLLHCTRVPTEESIFFPCLERVDSSMSRGGENLFILEPFYSGQNKF